MAPFDDGSGLDRGAHRAMIEIILSVPLEALASSVSVAKAAVNETMLSV